MNKKIIIPVIALIIVLTGGILAWKYFEAPKEVVPEEEIIKDETADWKAYRNEEWGFEIKHPENLNPEVIVDILAENMFALHFGDGKIFRMSTHNPDMEGHMRLYTIEGTEKEILIDNIKGSQFHIADMKGEVAYIPLTLVEDKGRLYVFAGEGKTFNQMLSTFRFLPY